MNPLFSLVIVVTTAGSPAQAFTWPRLYPDVATCRMAMAHEVWPQLRPKPGVDVTLICEPHFSDNRKGDRR